MKKNVRKGVNQQKQQEQKKHQRREQWRQSMVTLNDNKNQLLKTLSFLSVFALFVGLLFWLAPWNAFVTLRNIRWEGQQVLQPLDLMERTQIQLGQNIWQLDVANMEQQLLNSSAWIADVQVRKGIWGSIKIKITEKSPVALLLNQQVWYWMAEDGTMQIALPPFDALPIVDATELESREVIGVALAKLKDSEHEIYNNIAQIRGCKKNGLEVTLVNKPWKLLVPVEPIWVQNYKAWIKAAPARMNEIKTLDLRFDDYGFAIFGV